MKPSKLKNGDKLLFKCSDGKEHEATFICREAARFGRAPKNFVRFPHLAGLDGPDDTGICQVSDYDLSRKGRLANV